MIAIQRPLAPTFLTDPNEKWMQETEKAKTHYKNGTTEPFEFKMYNDTRVKDELKKVFVKCAYCESNYGAVYDGDVEHFRPKGKIKERTPQTPGYYWLANDWDNLFLACQHCNQRRKHILYGENKLEGYGKLDQFPLDPESKRISGPEGVLEDEETARLLINPCKDKPDEHIAYEKEEGVIVPLTEKGKTSARVYVLQRPYLVQERKKKLLKLFKQMFVAKTALEASNADPTNPILKQLFKDTLDIVFEFTKPEEEYAGMCRFFVKEFLKENGLA